MGSPDRSSTTRAAFTLIEILVVIAIIAVLAALIYPAVLNSQRTAYAATSVSNLKQWHVGFSGSLAEHNNEMPSDGSGSFRLNDAAAWYNRMPPEIKVAPLMSATTLPKMREKSVWINPGAPAQGAADLPFCYGFNDYLSTGDEPNMKVTRVAFPAKTLLMAEKVPDKSPVCNPTNIRSYYAAKDQTDPEAVCNILFVDGHVEGMKRKVFADTSATTSTTEDQLRQALFTWQPYENAGP